MRLTDATFHLPWLYRLPAYRRSFIVVDNKQFLPHLSRTYVAQTMEQFHVLVRLTTVLGNQYGYNFKSPSGGFYEPDLVSSDDCQKYQHSFDCVNFDVSLQLLLYGDETAERLAHEVACELGYATPDGMQVCSSNDTSATLHSKVNIHFIAVQSTLELPSIVRLIRNLIAISLFFTLTTVSVLGD